MGFEVYIIRTGRYGGQAPPRGGEAEKRAKVREGSHRTWSILMGVGREIQL